MLSYYFAVGLGVYLAAAAGNPNFFKDTTAVALIKGVAFGLILWPVGLVVLYLESQKPKA